MDNAPLYHPYLGCAVTLIGGGGIGSNLLPLLVKCGPTRLTIWDDDIAKPVNLAQQQFRALDIGQSKAEILARAAVEMDPNLRVVYKVARFRQGSHLGGLVISGVDSMESRHVIFDEVCRQSGQVALFVDGRISRRSNEWVELYFIDPKKESEVEYYREWLYENEGGEPKAPRPTKLSAHTPILLAGLFGAGMARWVHEGRHPLKVTLDASTFTLLAFW